MIKVSHQSPQAPERFRLIREIMEQPQRDFTGMLVNPLLEEFHQAMQPIYEQAGPLMEALLRLLFSVGIPLLKAFNALLGVVDSFFSASSRVTSISVVGTPLSPWTNEPTGPYPSGKIQDIEEGPR